MSVCADLWPDVLNYLKKTVREQQFETWFKCLRPDCLEPGVARLKVPNQFYKAWLSERYMPTLQEAFMAVAGEHPEISFVIDAELEVGSEDTTGRDVERSAAGGAAAPQFTPASDSRREQRIQSEMRLNPLYTFEHFVVGPSNSLPHAAALAVVDSASQAYNPLFVHAPLGMGKTHLVHAVCHGLLSKRPDLNILYLSCEGFVNQFIAAIEHGELEKFRYRYRQVDVLLVDDIHSLQGKERTQEEFFHTFNTLHNDQKQIVLSSDSPPSEIPKLEERLVSRFNWGLVTRIDPPSYETRVAIVRKKAQVRGRSFPDDVAEFIAESVAKNIRELEGAVVTVLAYASLANKAVTLSLARDALRERIDAARAKPGFDTILDLVLREYRVRHSDLQSKRRSRTITLPRQVCMFLARRHTNLSLEEIGGHFGGRDHSTVLHACEKIEHLIQDDPVQAARITSIERALLNQRP